MVPLTDGYPAPSPYSSCDAGCPSNAFQVLGSEPAFVDSIVVPLRQALTILLFAAVSALLVNACTVRAPSCGAR